MLRIAPFLAIFILAVFHVPLSSVAMAEGKCKVFDRQGRCERCSGTLHNRNVIMYCANVAHGNYHLIFSSESALPEVLNPDKGSAATINFLLPNGKSNSLHGGKAPNAPDPITIVGFGDFQSNDLGVFLAGKNVDSEVKITSCIIGVDNVMCRLSGTWDICTDSIDCL